MAVAGLRTACFEEQLDTADLHGAVARQEGKHAAAQPERERAITNSSPFA